MSLKRPGQRVHRSSLIDAARGKTVTSGTRPRKNVKTENGAPTYNTSGYAVLDMFFLSGASRTMTTKEIEQVFAKAMQENALLAIRCLFYSRDIRGGQGERRFFRICFEYLRRFYRDIYNTVARHVPEYGRWDDLFFTPEHFSLNKRLIKEGLRERNGLLAKWLPRKGPIARKLREYLHLTPYQYRRKIVNLSKTVEQDMCARTWKRIAYDAVPSVAMNKYRKAFFRHDADRFANYINAVKRGNRKINASAIFPHTLVRAMYNGGNRNAIEVQWNAQPNYMKNSNDRILPICDSSWSMKRNGGLPMDVSLALGVYISERNEGIFKDAFMTFSANPEMHYVKGSLYDRLKMIENANAGYNTNLVKSFNLILDSAIKHHVPQKEMPSKILVISDMEFDGTGADDVEAQKKSRKEFLSNYEIIKNKYKKAGYIMPTLIFWNVNGRAKNVPGTKYDANVGLVSGFSPSILKTILQGDVLSPQDLMLRTINSDRYRGIKI